MIENSMPQNTTNPTRQERSMVSKPTKIMICHERGIQIIDQENKEEERKMYQQTQYRGENKNAILDKFLDLLKEEQ
jgi:hypothetical protein